MKNIFFVILLLFTVNFCKAQTESKDENSDKKYFIVSYSTGSNWNTAKEYYEQDYFEDHSNHLNKLRAEGTIVLGGRHGDIGMLIIIAENELIANKLITNDLSIKHKTFKVKIEFFDPFYAGQINLKSQE